MKHFLIGLIVAVILITTFSAVLAGTSGAIQGIILDVETKKPLQSVNIILVGTKIGAVSKEDGTFRIDNLSSGSYGLNASIIGYDKGYKLDVNVVPNITTNVEFRLKESFFSMNQVVVTATRTNRIYANVPIATEVITSQEIEESGARDLSELLEDRAGVLPEPGVAGGRHINLLGSDSKYVLILIDGEPVNGKFNDRVELDDIITSGIERIEIVKGPASSLYGSEAMSGVVNVITRNANSKFEFMGKTRISSNDGKEVNFNVGSKKNEFSYFIQGSYYSSGVDKNDPFLSIDNFSKKSLSGKLKYQLSPLNQILFKTDIIKNREEGNLVSLKSRSDIFRRNSELKYVFPYRDWANFELKIRNSSYEREFSKIDSKNDTVLESEITTQNYNEIEANYIREANELFKFNFGYEYSSDNLESPRLGGDNSFTLNHQHFYAQSESVITPQFVITAGVRLDVNSDIENHTSPRTGFLYNFSDELKIRGSWGRGFRIPSLINKFIDFPNLDVGYTVVGNPDLLPEKSEGVNLGIEYYLFRKSLISFNYFQNDFTNMITDITVSPATRTSPAVLSYINLNSTTLRGIEAQSKIFFSVYLTTQISYNYLDAINNDNGNYLPNRARHSGTLKTTIRFGNTRTTTRVAYVGERNQRIFDGTQFLEEIFTADPYLIMDLTVNTKITEHYILSGGIDNIFDHTDIQFGPWTGRKYYLGFETRW